MNFSREKLLYRKLKGKGFYPAHVAEVGVYLPQTSNVINYIQQGVRTTLVEANPYYAQIIKDYFAGHCHVTLHQVAIYDREGTIDLHYCAASSFVSTLETSPAIANDTYQKCDADKFTVPAKKFDSIDDGTIDLLSIDIEGCEWYVLKHMKSRPAVISVETHGKHYVNPFISEILHWMEKNGYQLWYKDSNDSVYIRQGLFEITLWDRLQNYLTEWRLNWQRTKAHWKNVFAGKLRKR
ncbi:MAG: FkbM family methyltransferase [Cytophagales bacterium]|nr:FkbM family methyltransferase [Bernardetiaceae bacterium]MDW8210312.1 FkbM family methyltransferase [Cytophagales bacterium]